MTQPSDQGMPTDVLRRFELFQSVAPEHVRAVARAFRREEFAEGERIFSEGDPGDKLYLIESGAVRVTQALGSAGEEALAVLHGGDFVGDMSLIDARPRSAHAIAHEDCVLYSLERSVFIMLLKLNGQLAVDVLFQFLSSLCRRLRENNERIRAMNMMSMW